MTVVTERQSYSRANELLQCGVAYDLHRNQNAPIRPTLARVGGLAVHSWAYQLEHYQLGTPDTRLDDWLWHFENELTTAEEESGLHRSEFRVSGRRTKDHPDKETIEVWRDELGPDMVAKYLAHDWGDWAVATDLPPDPSGNTVGLEYEIDLEDFRGFVDRIDRDANGNFRVVDYKTWARARVSAQLQLYMAALQRLSVRAVYGAYYDARKGLLLETHPSKWSAERMTAYLELAAWGVRMGTEEGKWLPNIGDHCNYCDVRGNCAYQT